MKNAGRLTVLLLILALVLPLIACTSASLQPNETKTQTAEATAAAPAEETEEETTEEKPEVTTKKKKKVYQLEEYMLADIADDICVLGERCYFDTDGGLTADWPCSGFEVTFETQGTDFAFSLDTNYQNYIKVIVDGEPLANRFALSTRSEKKVVVKDMEAGTHVVRILKDGQLGTAEGNYCKFLSVHIEGTILHTDNEERPLYLEFVGDSIWCGGGANGNSANSSNYANETSASAAVPYITAQALDAEYNVTARGSIGIYATVPTEGGLSMCDLYFRQNGYRDDVAYKPTRTPDAIIVCLGTNDPKAAGGNFVEDGTAFFQKIRALYGNDVPIIWTYGMMNRYHMLTEMEMIQKALGGEEANFYLLQMSYGQNGSGSGADNRHPSAADHQRNADTILIPFLKDLLQLD